MYVSGGQRCDPHRRATAPPGSPSGGEPRFLDARKAGSPDGHSPAGSPFGSEPGTTGRGGSFPCCVYRGKRGFFPVWCFKDKSSWHASSETSGKAVKRDSLRSKRRWKRRGGERFFERLCHRMWLFRLHSTVKRRPFSPVFPSAESMFGAFYWLFLWHFKE